SDDVPLPGTLGRLAAVLEPDNVAIKVLDHDYIGLAVAVNVANGVAFEPAGLLFGDEVPGEVPLAVVFEPVERLVVFGVAAGEVEIAIAVEVGHGDAVSVAVLVLDQVLRKTDVAARHRFPGIEHAKYDHHENDELGHARRRQTLHSLRSHSGPFLI